eukprot:1135917-Prymnesium_polylepis.1
MQQEPGGPNAPPRQQGLHAFDTLRRDHARGRYPELEFTFFLHTHSVRKSVQNNVQPLGRFLRGPTFSSE